MKISVIIPSYNRKKELCMLLDQLVEQADSSQHLYDVIAVIDGSTDGSIETVADQYPSVNVVEGDGGWWYTKSINEGFQFAKKFDPDFLLLLNDDVVLSDNYLDILVGSAISHPDPAVFGSVSESIETKGKITFSGVSRINKLVDKTYTYNGQISLHTNTENLVPSVVLPGRGMLMPFKIMNELNGFDPVFFQYQSDYDFCLRAARKGYKSYVIPEAVVYGYELKTSESSTSLKPGIKKMLKSMFDSKSRYFIPNRGTYYWRHYFKILWPFYMMKYINSIVIKSLK